MERMFGGGGGPPQLPSLLYLFGEGGKELAEVVALSWAVVSGRFFKRGILIRRVPPAPAKGHVAPGALGVGCSGGGDGVGALVGCFARQQRISSCRRSSRRGTGRRGLSSARSIHRSLPDIARVRSGASVFWEESKLPGPGRTGRS